MRVFVAAELPDHMRDALAETSALLRAGLRGRFVAPDSFHVTLAFLGDVDPWRIDDAADAIERACQELQAANCSFGDLGSFGRRSSATLWQGFNDPGILPIAARQVRGELKRQSFTFDAKKFLPHVTLMRAVDLTSGALPAPVQAAGLIDRVTLFRSDLSGPRPIYEPLHTVEL